MTRQERPGTPFSLAALPFLRDSEAMTLAAAERIEKLSEAEEAVFVKRVSESEPIEAVVLLLHSQRAKKAAVTMKNALIPPLLSPAPTLYKLLKDARRDLMRSESLLTSRKRPQPEVTLSEGREVVTPDFFIYLRTDAAFSAPGLLAAEFLVLFDRLVTALDTAWLEGRISVTEHGMTLRRFEGLFYKRILPAFGRLAGGRPT